jgi:hypothetical protein
MRFRVRTGRNQAQAAAAPPASANDIVVPHCAAIATWLAPAQVDRRQLDRRGGSPRADFHRRDEVSNRLDHGQRAGRGRLDIGVAPRLQQHLKPGMGGSGAAGRGSRNGNRQKCAFGSQMVILRAGGTRTYRWLRAIPVPRDFYLANQGPRCARFAERAERRMRECRPGG